MKETLKFEGSSCFRSNIVCAVLAQRNIHISEIHSQDENAGLNPVEINFLKFVETVTSGGKMTVSGTKTDLSFTPGVIVGGSFSHNVPTQRAVGYIVEAALLLLPFASVDSEITLLGSTQGEEDISVDTLRTVTMRWMQMFGVEASIRVVRRGAAPNGGGCVILSVKAIRVLRSIDATKRGKVRRVRGVAFGSRTSADLPQRAATAAKGVLLGFLPDVYVVTDITHRKGQSDTGSSGYGVMLVAESTSKTAVLSQESVASAKSTPQDVGESCAKLLLDQIAENGNVDSHHQMLVITLMGLSPDEVSTLRVGHLTPSGISALAQLETFFNVTCAVKSDDNGGHLVTCIGCNMVNTAKRAA